MVYVDWLCRHGWVMRGKTIMSCHLYADTELELHKFALSIGLKRTWFQKKRNLPHYDLTPNKRKQAVDKGAHELTKEEFKQIYYKYRGVNEQNK